VSISDSLPKTIFIKLVELWLLFSLTQPFLDVLLQTYIQYLNTILNKANKAATAAW
jgi:hypothetical protein